MAAESGKIIKRNLDSERPQVERSDQAPQTNKHSSEPKILPLILAISLVMLPGMFLFELAEDLGFEHIEHWKLPTITTLFSSIIATLAFVGVAR